jgi:hypothetical protein
MFKKTPNKRPLFQMSANFWSLENGSFVVFAFEILEIEDLSGSDFSGISAAPISAPA